MTTSPTRTADGEPTADATEPTTPRRSREPDRPGWIRRLVTQALLHRRIAVGALLVTAVASVVDSLFPLLTKLALDTATGARTPSADTTVGQVIGFAAAAVAVGAGVRFACQYGRRLLAGRLSLSVQHDLRMSLLASLQRLDGPGQDRVRTGQVVSRSISDLQMVQGVLAMTPMAAGSLLSFVLSLVFMLTLSPLLTTVTLVTVPALFLVVRTIRPRLFAATWSAQQRAADLAQHVEETVTGVRVVKGFGQEDRAVDVLERHGRRLYAERLRAAHHQAWFASLLGLIPQLGLIGVVALGGWMTMHGSITIGTFLAFTTYLTTLVGTTRMIAATVVQALLARAAVERVYEIVDTRPTVPEPADPVALPPGALGVRFDDVEFRFGARPTTGSLAGEPRTTGSLAGEPMTTAPLAGEPMTTASTAGEPLTTGSTGGPLPIVLDAGPAAGDRAVLDGLDLDIAPGETVAVIGPSGSGKTAMSLLLPRFYAPDRGRVLLDSASGRTVDIADLAADDLRAAVGIVFDEPFLFSDSIAANIALGAPDATEADIREAADLACVTDFVDDLDEGFDTEVGERGLTLSGGQRQRIALARALLARPRVLVLDDATSAVDAETEATIFRRLDGRALHGAAPRTTILLAHRRSTLLLADRVVVLDHGRVVDTGTVDELERRSPLFRRLMTGDPERDEPTAGGAPDGHDARPVAARPVARPDESRLWPTDVPAPDADADAPTPGLRRLIDDLEPATESPHADSASIRAPMPDFRLGLILRPVRALLAIVVLLLAFGSLVSVVVPSIVRVAVDEGVGARDPSRLWIAVAIGAGLVLADAVATWVLTVTTARTGERVLFGLRVRSYAHLQRLGLEFYERELSGRIMTRMTTDVDALSTFLQTGLSTSVVGIVTLAGIAVALVWTDATLAAVVLAVMPVLVLATVWFRRVSSAAYSESRELISTVNADFQENVTGLRTSQAYRRERVAAERFEARSTAYLTSRMRAQRAISLYFPFIAALSDLALAAVLFVGAHEIAAGSTTPGVLVAFVLYLGLLFGPIQQLSQVFDGYQQARVGLRRIGDLLRTPTTVVDRADARPPDGPWAGAVHLDHVDFAYAGADTDALSGVDLRIAPGSTVALVGRTGAGKSTVVKLVARFYDPTAGAVRVDGTDVRDLRLRDYRRRLGVVPQEAHLFTGTIAENIAFGDPTASRERIERAAAAVGALDTVADLPYGMATPVGERGQGLSAGQRQLVALARAELVEPDLLLLDEATATLDPATERAVLDASDTLTRTRTAIVVAHRLATADRADRVVVIDGGRMVESGAPAELRGAGGPYSRLWAAAESRTGNNVPPRTVVDGEPID